MLLKLRQDNLGLWRLLRACVLPSAADPASILEFWVGSSGSLQAGGGVVGRLHGIRLGRRQMRQRVYCGLLGVLMVLLGLGASGWAMWLLQ